MPADTPMTLEQALSVCDQVSPMPGVAHQALQVLRRELLAHTDYEAFVLDNWNRRRADFLPPDSSLEVEAMSTEHRDLLTRYEALRQRYIMDVGFGGESGEVLELVKKHERDGVLDRRELAMELGDALHYLTKIGQRYGISLGDIKRINRQKLLARRRGGKGAFTVEDVVLPADRPPWPIFEYAGEPAPLDEGAPNA
jgi:NTP pyrophosphatase (non-canonical NTP hydrolase)